MGCWVLIPTAISQVTDGSWNLMRPALQQPPARMRKQQTVPEKTLSIDPSLYLFLFKYSNIRGKTSVFPTVICRRDRA